MPRRAFRCTVEITANAVTCPGTWLPRRDDLFLSISLLGQTRRTLLTGPIFPLLFHEKFYFDRVFYSCFEPSQVVDSLEDVLVLVELVQLSDIYDGGRLLASYESNARDFLYPYPSYTATYGTHDREVLLDRTLDFPGICPKFEFSTKTTIEETSAPAVDYYTETLTPRRSRSRTRSRARSPVRTTSYGRPTVSSISRSRSLSPVRRSLAATSLSDTDDYRPPFVVRKALYDSELDAEVDAILNKPKTYIPPYRPTSPLLYTSPVRDYSSSLRDYSSPMRDLYLDRPWSPYRSALVSARVDRALARNRSLDRLRLDRSLDDLALERHRRWRARDTAAMIPTVPGTSEYWDQMARQPADTKYRDQFYSTLERTYSNLYNVYKRARSRTQFLGY